MGGSVARRRVTAAILLACACVLVGVSGGGYAAAPTTLTMALGIDEDTLDPEGQTTATVSNVVDYMYDPLVWYNDERSGVAPGQPQYTKLMPQLATLVDGRVRTGARSRSSCGRGSSSRTAPTFDSQAVKFNIQRMAGPAMRNNAATTGATLDANNIETPDPSTIVLHFTKPAPTLLEQLATTAAEIVSPTAVKTLGNEKIALAPVNAGSGPYVFKEWVHGDHLTVTRNPDYWGRKPYFDQVIFRVVPDAGARETMLRAGDVQFAFEPPAPDVPATAQGQHAAGRRGRERPRHLHRHEQPVRPAQGCARAPGAQLRRQQAGDHAQRAVRTRARAGVAGHAGDLRLHEGAGGRVAVRTRPWRRSCSPRPGIRRASTIALRAPTGRYIQDYQSAQAVAAQLTNVGMPAKVQTADWPSYIGSRRACRRIGARSRCTCWGGRGRTSIPTASCSGRSTRECGRPTDTRPCSTRIPSSTRICVTGQTTDQYDAARGDL